MDIRLLVARIPVCMLFPSDGSPSDMSLWPSDILANRFITLQSIEKEEKKDETTQERERRKMTYTQAAAERALSPTHIPGH
jgi:hypothetical protein